MRIVIHDMSGHPFQVQLSRVLARKGHDVLHLYCESFSSPRGDLTRHPGDATGFDVRGLSLGEPFDKYKIVKRIRQEITYSKILARELEIFAPNLVMTSNTPLFCQALTLKWCSSSNVAHVLWLQDFYSKAMGNEFRRRLRILGAPLSWLVGIVERWVVRRSAAVVAISKDFELVVREWKKWSKNLFTIHNWAPLEQLPVRPRANDWSYRYGLDTSFVYLYSGTLGIKHNPNLLWSLAAEFRPNPEVKVVIISEGLGMDWLRDKNKSEPLENLILLPYQEFDDYPNVLASADVLVAILEGAAGAFSVPSKILSYHCAGRPILAALPKANLASDLMGDNRTGVVVTPDDSIGFLNGARLLFADPPLRAELGANARKWAESNFDIEVISSQFQSVLNEAVGDSQGAPASER